jgi:hypothetical protein
MKFYELELNGEIVKLRLTSGDCIQIEKKYGKSVLEFIQNMSMTTVITLLQYMARSSEKSFNEEKATKLYDDMIDSGYTLSTIISDVIMGVLEVSGFMSKEDLEASQEKIKEAQEKARNV